MRGFGKRHGLLLALVLTGCAQDGELPAERAIAEVEAARPADPPTEPVQPMGQVTPPPDRPLEFELTARREESRAKPATERREIMDRAARELAESAIIEHSLAVGDTMPVFRLPNARGELVSSEALLADGPLVVTFYRGGWCPYCNLTLRAMQTALPDLRAAGATLVAITPEPPAKAGETRTETGSEFLILSDAGNATAREFGIVFTLPPDLREVYRGFGTDLAEWNQDEAWTLPLPATYVVRPNGEVAWRFVDTDYTRRAEPADIVAAVKALGAG